MEGWKRLCFFFGDLWKHFTNYCSTSSWKILDYGIMLARFLCLSGFRIRSTVAEAQEMLTAEHTCFLLVSLQSVLSHHEYPARGVGKGLMERVREQKMLGIKESARGSRKLLPATWRTDAGKWAASPTDSNLAASSACTRYTSSAKHRELWLCISSSSMFSVVWGMPALCQCELEPVHSELWAELWAGVPWLLQPGEPLRCSNSITWTAAQLYARISIFASFSCFQSISLWCLGRKGFSGSHFSMVWAGHLPIMGWFSKNFN